MPGASDTDDLQGHTLDEPHWMDTEDCMGGSIQAWRCWTRDPRGKWQDCAYGTTAEQARAEALRMLKARLATQSANPVTDEAVARARSYLEHTPYPPIVDEVVRMFREKLLMLENDNNALRKAARS